MIIEDKIKKIISENGFIAVDDFMKLALFDEDAGYYIKKDPLGEKQDFITAPEISGIFGECLAGFIIVQTENLKNSPKINLIELGAGRGTLMHDILGTISKFPVIYQKIESYILDVNEKLVEIQKKKLIKHNDKIKWINNIDDVPDAPCIFLANEFFDALPVKQFTKVNGEIKERVIKFDSGFYFDLVNAKLPDILKTDKKDYDENSVIEFSEESVKFTEQISQKILSNKGMAIIIDYGHVNFASGDSLQSIYKHNFNNIFENIGNADITTHVNFRLLSAVFASNNINNIFVQTQGGFLKSLGIVERAERFSKNLNDNEKNDFLIRINRLINEDEMGEIFKCLVAENF